ncbi:ABC transporter substrate-binding protein [Halorubrum sp. BOL3-1]|uniref:ABC transporter substrate-binding protein n=1 Tax=Halorubrum sp. BOL3-1 TaxID=2497325 RepID=UPI00140B6B92|nr:ABC transporter substrate-binding protein [Halorubrum sp. BOL3-1]
MPETDNGDGQPRRTFLKVAGSVGTVGLAGCSGNQSDGGDSDGSDGGDSDGSDGAANEETSGNTLSLSIPDASNFDPVQIKDDGSQVISDHVFSELFALPEGSLEPTAQLVADYSVSEDGRTYTFELREDVTFHNGDQLTAQDVVYSWERLAASENSQEGENILEGGFQIAHDTTTETVEGEEQEVYEPGSLDVEAVDDYTVETTLESPFFDALFWFAYGSLSPVPEGIVGDVEGYDGEMEYSEFSSQQPVGTGPYRVESVSTGTEVVLTADEEYHGEEPGPDRIAAQVVTNTDAVFRRAMNRNVDVFRLPNSRFDPSKVSIEETRELGQEVGTYGPLENGETANYATFDDAYTAYFIFDCSRVEKPIRQALNYAVNQENFVEQGFRGVGEPAYHQAPPSVYPGGKEEYDRHAEENFPYGYREARLDEARSVMEDAGYGEDNRASITLSLYNDRNPDAYSRIADLIRSKAESIYIDLEINRAPFNTIIDEAVSGNLDMYTLGNGLEYPSPMDMLKFGRPYDGNLVRWREDPSDASAQADEAWQRIQGNLGPTDAEQEARNEAFIEMEEAIWEDAVYLPNYHPRGREWWYDDVDVPFQTSGFHDRLFDGVTFE